MEDEKREREREREALNTKSMSWPMPRYVRFLLHYMCICVSMRMCIVRQVDTWDEMERFWQQSIFRRLRCEPEDHAFLLTEPPLNPPENREYTAEIFFESFNVAGLYIAVQVTHHLSFSSHHHLYWKRIMMTSVVWRIMCEHGRRS